jgi:hypothetical protein
VAEENLMNGEIVLSIMVGDYLDISFRYVIDERSSVDDFGPTFSDYVDGLESITQRARHALLLGHADD